MLSVAMLRRCWKLQYGEGSESSPVVYGRKIKMEAEHDGH
jgi:hypothetical protein